MGFVVKITSFLYRYLNGRDEKTFVKKPRTRGGPRIRGARIRGGLVYIYFKASIVISKRFEDSNFMSPKCGIQELNRN